MIVLKSIAQIINMPFICTSCPCYHCLVDNLERTLKKTTSMPTFIPLIQM